MRVMRLAGPLNGHQSADPDGPAALEGEAGDVGVENDWPHQVRQGVECERPALIQPDAVPVEAEAVAQQDNDHQGVLQPESPQGVMQSPAPRGGGRGGWVREALQQQAYSWTLVHVMECTPMCG